MPESHEIEIRVRYQETDGQGHVHHANYLAYFELGRTEMMRARGHAYQDLEAAGLFLVVAEISCRYFQPARFGDVLTLCTTTVKAKGARVVHEYTLLRGDQMLAKGSSTVGCVDRQGRVRRLPHWLSGDRRSADT